jgi:putative membrane protein
LDVQIPAQQPDVAPKKDSASNLRRRYRHLFRLPARNRTLAYASGVALAITAISRIGLSTPYFLVAAYLAVTEAVLLLSVEIDRRVLHARKIATFRRLASLSILSNAFWVVLTFVGFIIFLITRDPTRLISLVILGFFFAVGFRALIIGSLFYPKPRDAIPLAFVQPILMLGPVAFSLRLGIRFFTHSIDPLAAIIGGVISIVAIESYIATIDKIRVGTYKPFALLQAFLNAWAAEDATNLERILETTSKETTVTSQMLELKSDQFEANIIVPGIHPGPFYPIGSSNIPGDIFRGMRGPHTFPMVVHSMSDHELNLSSKRQVERYISTLQSSTPPIDKGSTASGPVVIKQGKATICSISFGNTVMVTISQAPYGMEDFPSEVRRRIEDHSMNVCNFKNVLVVDTHNSEGEKPNAQECEDAVTAAKRALDQLSKAKQCELKVGISHSSELGGKLPADIGPAGVGFLNFDQCGSKFSLVIVDSNNSVLGFREETLRDYEKNTGSRILELCTSDTHVTAAKTADAKGYLALGDVSKPADFADLLSKLHDKAAARLASASYSSFAVESNVKTIGGEVLSNFSGLVDTASAEAKNGAQILGALAFIITVAVALI